MYHTNVRLDIQIYLNLLLYKSNIWFFTINSHFSLIHLQFYDYWANHSLILNIWSETQTLYIPPCFQLNFISQRYSRFLSFWFWVLVLTILKLYKNERQYTKNKFVYINLGSESEKQRQISNFMVLYINFYFNKHEPWTWTHAFFHKQILRTISQILDLIVNKF